MRFGFWVWWLSQVKVYSYDEILKIKAKAYSYSTLGAIAPLFTDISRSKARVLSTLAAPMV